MRTARPPDERSGPGFFPGPTTYRDDDPSIMTPGGHDVDLVALPLRLWRLWQDGYRVGFVHGIERGRDLADAEAAELHRRASEVVGVMAGLSPSPLLPAD